MKFQELLQVRHEENPKQGLGAKVDGQSMQRLQCQARLNPAGAFNFGRFDPDLMNVWAIYQ